MSGWVTLINPYFWPMRKYPAPPACFTARGPVTVVWGFISTCHEKQKGPVPLRNYFHCFSSSPALYLVPIRLQRLGHTRVPRQEATPVALEMCRHREKEIRTHNWCTFIAYWRQMTTRHLVILSLKNVIIQTKHSGLNSLLWMGSFAIFLHNLTETGHILEHVARASICTCT